MKTIANCNCQPFDVVNFVLEDGVKCVNSANIDGRITVTTNNIDILLFEISRVPGTPDYAHSLHLLYGSAGLQIPL